MSDEQPRLPTPQERSWTASDLLGNRPFVIAVLYLFTFLTAMSCVVGVVLAYVFREARSEDWEQSHFTYQIRTFWLFMLALVVGLATGFVLFATLSEDLAAVLALGLALLVFGTFILAAVRTVYSMLNAVREKPMPRPRSLLV